MVWDLWRDRNHRMHDQHPVALARSTNFWAPIIFSSLPRGYSPSMASDLSCRMLGIPPLRDNIVRTIWRCWRPAHFGCTINLAIFRSFEETSCTFLVRKPNGAFIAAYTFSSDSDNDILLLSWLAHNAMRLARNRGLDIGAIQGSHADLIDLQDAFHWGLEQVEDRAHSGRGAQPRVFRISSAENKAASVIAAVERRRGFIGSFDHLQSASKRAIVGDCMKLPSGQDSSSLQV